MCAPREDPGVGDDPGAKGLGGKTLSGDLAAASYVCRGMALAVCWAVVFALVVRCGGRSRQVGKRGRTSFAGAAAASPAAEMPRTLLNCSKMFIEASRCGGSGAHRLGG
jgi:hypothetical protein